MATTRNTTDLASRASSFSNTQASSASREVTPQDNITVLTPNLDPRSQTVLNKKVVCITYDKTNPNSQNTISEGYVVTPNFVPTEVSGGISMMKKFVIKLGDTNYALKFHLPQGGENTMYITFAIKNVRYIDGYQDYVSKVPSAYITALKAWCGSSSNANITRTISSATTIKKKRLIFSFTGKQTTDKNKTGKFYVDIKYQTSIISSSITDSQISTITSTERFNSIR